jgi:predicted MPP superfamily phosphohydrolase
MERIFAIGDIHGCSKTFEKLLFDKIKIQKTDKLYCIGDYIDRGKNSKAVIDLILQLRSEGYTLFTLRGNHEQMLLDSFIYGEAFDLWMQNGGDQTLQSFSIDSLENLPKKYLSFFNETQFYFETEEYIFVHAGLNFHRKNIFEDKEAMLWIRDFSSYQPALKNKLLIHGHTPISLKYILNQKGNCIDIDAGCVFNYLAPFGNLVAIDLNERRILWEENCE